MEVHYCDLCSNPLKDGQSFMLFVSEPTDLKSGEDIHDYIHKVQAEQKEICPTCYHLFKKIFEHRLEGMADLTEECYTMFGLPYIEKHIKKLKGKNVKKNI
jgi:protein-arginine kinase activator protein McsA